MNLKALYKATLIIGFAAILLSVLDFLALHDIHKDYVSQKVLSSLDITNANLPGFTQTRSEWSLISFSFVSKLLFLIFNSIVLILGLNFINRKTI